MRRELRTALLWFLGFLALETALFFVQKGGVNGQTLTVLKPSKQSGAHEPPTPLSIGGFMEPNCADPLPLNNVAFLSDVSYGRWLRQTHPEELQDSSSRLVGCMIRRNDRRYYRSHTRVIASDRSSVLWVVEGHGEPQSMVAGPDDTLYVSFAGSPGNPGKTCRFDRNGKELWCQLSGKFGIPTLVAVQPDGIVYGLESDSIVSFGADGQMRFRSRPGSGLLGLAIGPEGHLYVTDWEGLYALDQEGRKLWEVKHVAGSLSQAGTSQVPGPVVSSDGTVYFAASSLFAVSPQGQIKWTFTPKTQRYRQTTFAQPLWLGQDGSIYAATYDSQLYAVDRNGHIEWVFFDERFHSIAGLQLDSRGALEGFFDEYGAKKLAIFSFSVYSPPMKNAWPTHLHDAGGSGLADYEEKQ